jgi:hypothetical protein
LIDLLRRRRSKSLPRQFVLAVTADRVVAYKASGGGDSESNYEVRIAPGECGSWPRASVWIAGETLELDGVERIPVARSNMNRDPNTDELLEVLRA